LRRTSTRAISKSGERGETKSRHDAAADERFSPAVDQIPELIAPIPHAGIHVNGLYQDRRRKASHEKN
jgi:hypothetical protein